MQNNFANNTQQIERVDNIKAADFWGGQFSRKIMILAVREHFFGLGMLIVLVCEVCQRAMRECLSSGNSCEDRSRQRLSVITCVTRTNTKHIFLFKLTEL